MEVMILFRWRDAYSVKIKVIDEQHKNLFRIGRELFDILNKAEDYNDIIKILEELKNYAVYHFSEEEKYMKKFNYVEYDKHKAEHDFFIEKIKKLDIEKGIKEDQREIISETLAFIEKWIESHILRSDQRYSKFFNERGIF